MTIFPDLMVDIETTGLNPDRSAIIQLAAVPFNIETREIDTNNMFNQALNIPPWRHWDMGTRQWWGRQPDVLRDIESRMQPWDQVISAFQQWAAPVGKYRWWSKPSHFDYNFVDSYFKDAGLITPFSFRDATDQNSFIRGLWFPHKVPGTDIIDVPFTGPAHNAIYDAIHQIGLLFKHLEAAGDLHRGPASGPQVLDERAVESSWGTGNPAGTMV